MGRRVLVTGGAGFIGTHLCDRLLAEGFEVRVLDNLCAQVHGGPRSPGRPRGLGLPADVEVMIRWVQPELPEERPGHGVVVVLSCIDELRVEPSAERRLERGGLDQLRSRPDDADDPH